MYVQPVQHRIEIHSLSTLLHPLNNTSNMITSKTHAYQFLNHVIIRMVSNELRGARVSDQNIGSTRWLLVLKRHKTLLKVR